jgi:hypothetical protein
LKQRPSRKAAKTQREEGRDKENKNGERESSLHLFFFASSSLCVLAALREDIAPISSVSV